MSQSKGFDMSKMSTASKILLGGGILYFIDLFLQWQRVCFNVVGITSGCGGVNGIHGIGILNMLIVLAIIDFPPNPNYPPVEGVPKNRGGHGIPQEVMVEELTSAGLQVDKTIGDWSGSDYCVIFKRPNRD